jgi:hypothetical protein
MVAAGLPPPLVALGSGRHPDDDGVDWRSSGARRWRSVGGLCDDGRRQALPLPPCFFLFGTDRTLVPSCDHGDGGVAAEGGSVAVVAGSIVGAVGALRGSARAARGGCQPRRPWGLGCPLYPPPLRQRRRPWCGGGSRRVCCRLWWRGWWAAGCGWRPRPLPPTPCSSSAVALASVVAGDSACGRRRAAASSTTGLPVAAGERMVGDGTVGGGTLLQLSCTCLVEAAQLMADVGWLSALWRWRR